MDEMPVDVEEDSVIFFIYYVVLEDLIVESAGKRSSRWHNYGVSAVLIVAERMDQCDIHSKVINICTFKYASQHNVGKKDIR